MLEIEMQFSALNTRTKSLTVDLPLGQYFGRFVAVRLRFLFAEVGKLADRSQNTSLQSNILEK